MRTRMCDGFASVVPIEAVTGRDGNLSIPLYVKRREGKGAENLGDAITRWRLTSAELRDAAEDLLQLFGAEVAR